MNAISQLRQAVQAHGQVILDVSLFNQLQEEWIRRAGAEELVQAEREACAQVCEAAKNKSRNALVRSAFTIAAGEIRARADIREG